MIRFRYGISRRAENSNLYAVGRQSIVVCRVPSLIDGQIHRLYVGERILRIAVFVTYRAFCLHISGRQRLCNAVLRIAVFIRQASGQHLRQIFPYGFPLIVFVIRLRRILVFCTVYPDRYKIRPLSITAVIGKILKFKRNTGTVFTDPVFLSVNHCGLKTVHGSRGKRPVII